METSFFFFPIFSFNTFFTCAVLILIIFIFRFVMIQNKNDRTFQNFHDTLKQLLMLYHHSKKKRNRFLLFSVENAFNSFICTFLFVCLFPSFLSFRQQDNPLHQFQPIFPLYSTNNFGSCIFCINFLCVFVLFFLCLS